MFSSILNVSLKSQMYPLNGWFLLYVCMYDVTRMDAIYSSLVEV